MSSSLQLFVQESARCIQVIKSLQKAFSMLLFKPTYHCITVLYHCMHHSCHIILINFVYYCQLKDPLSVIKLSLSNLLINHVCSSRIKPNHKRSSYQYIKDLSIALKFCSWYLQIMIIITNCYINIVMVQSSR